VPTNFCQVCDNSYVVSLRTAMQYNSMVSTTARDCHLRCNSNRLLPAEVHVHASNAGIIVKNVCNMNWSDIFDFFSLCLIESTENTL
jgi:hypothetical protein